MIQKYVRIGAVVVVGFCALFFIPNPFDKEEKVKTRNVITAAGKVGWSRITTPITQFGQDVAAQTKEENKNNPPPRQEPPQFTFRIENGNSTTVSVVPKQ